MIPAISQRRAAKVAGLTALVSMAVVMVANLGIQKRLLVPGDAAATARSILAHERLFRLGITGELLYATGLIVLLTALYVILSPVNRGLALFAAAARLAYAMSWVLMTLELFDVLRLISGAEYLRVVPPEHLQAMMRFSLRARFDEYYVGLLFYALASTVCGWLWLKSRYIPRTLAAFGVIASAWCVACTLVFFVFPSFRNAVNLWWFDSPMALFEMATSFWLLFKGLAPSVAAANAER